MNWTRRTFLTGAAAAPLFAQKRGRKDDAPSAKPNILLVMADEVPSWVLGCYGNQEIPTPNIDRMALGGSRFVRSFACTPAATANRVTLLSGRTPRQHGVHEAGTAPGSFANEKLLSDDLTGSGYRCGYAGLWDAGSGAPGHGFAHAGTAVSGKGSAAETVTAQALEFLDQQAKGTPFFLAISYPSPMTLQQSSPQKFHARFAAAKFESYGIQPAAEHAALGKEYLADALGNLRKYGAGLAELDEQLAALPRKLLAKSIFDNTLVVFTGTSGNLLGRHGLWGDGRGSKPANMYDEAVGVPMIWQWPGYFPVQAARPEVVSSYDVYPTLRAAAGIPLTDSKSLCGRDFLQVVMNRVPAQKKAWKDLVFADLGDTEMARDNYFKVVVRSGGEGPNEFYDLRQDSREKNNRWDNPGYVTVRDTMAKSLAEWRQTYG
ncbi:sulfatase-like hydrolase/transferase [uncultured Paludibaculum sp.]|uniref:sulfatase family protein n=1 Tax=uncultured Paludibaculum sp. TaxID=1765020 RepID=UPI002AAAD0D0|nr:sulfatase-like hydrolase/transferase [uncultured Paludibaculum sp.]